MNFNTIFCNLFVFGIVVFILWFVYAFSRKNARSESIRDFKSLPFLDKVKAYIQALYITFLGVIILTGGGIWYADSDESVSVLHYVNYDLVIESWIIIAITAVIGASKGFKEISNKTSGITNRSMN